MTRCLTTIVGVALVAVSCSRGVSRVQTHSLPTVNPTTYTFSLPLEELHARALEVFSVDHQLEEPIFGRSPSTVFLEGLLAAECATNASFSETVFREPANTNDIYLHSFHSPFV